MHVAISQALHLTMGRYGTRPVSHREFNAVIWQHDRRNLGIEMPSTLAEISRHGINLPQAHRVLPDFNAGGFVAQFISDRPGDTPEKRPGDDDAMRQAYRLITDSLSNGLPVIAMVDWGSADARNLAEGSGKACPMGIEGAKEEPPKTHAHAVLLLGMHLLHAPHEIPDAATETADYKREDVAELPGRFVLHDVDGPYQECSAKRLLEAALRARLPDGATGRYSRGIHLLVIGPKGMTLPLHEATRCAESNIEDRSKAGEKYLKAYARNYVTPDRDTPAQWRYVTRLLEVSEISARYGITTKEGKRVFNACFEDLAESTGHCWVVEARLALPRRSESDAPPLAALVYVWSVGDLPDLDPNSRLPRVVLRRRIPGEEEEDAMVIDESFPRGRQL